MEKVLRMSLSDGKGINIGKRMVRVVLMVACCAYLCLGIMHRTDDYGELAGIEVNDVLRLGCLKAQSYSSLHITACKASLVMASVREGKESAIAALAENAIQGIPGMAENVLAAHGAEWTDPPEDAVSARAAYAGITGSTVVSEKESAEISCDVAVTVEEVSQEAAVDMIAAVAESPTIDVVSVVSENPTTDVVSVVAENDMEPQNEIIIAGFICDSEGYIIDYTDTVDTTDGLLVLPFDEACIGIREGALDGLSAQVTEIYIPANICEIESGALDGLSSLLFIKAADGHPCYYTGAGDGSLYTISGEKIARPLGWELAFSK